MAFLFDTFVYEDFRPVVIFYKVERPSGAYAVRITPPVLVVSNQQTLTDMFSWEIKVQNFIRT